MQVRVVALTQPQIEGLETAQDFIGYAARVSNPDNQMNTLTAPKLLKYCADHRHWSIFEMAQLVMEIKTTRAIAHQIIRHKSFSFQEFSQRYAKATGFEVQEARMQDKKNRQSSLPCTHQEI